MPLLPDAIFRPSRCAAGDMAASRADGVPGVPGVRGPPLGAYWAEACFRFFSIICSWARRTVLSRELGSGMTNLFGPSPGVA